MGEHALLHRFNADVSGASREGDRITLTIENWRPLSFSPPTPQLADAVMELRGEGQTFDALVDTAGGPEAPKAVSGVRHYLERFRFGRLLEWEAREDGETLAVFEPLTKAFDFREGAMPDGALTLSRFAYARRDGGALVLESPEVGCRVILRGRGTGWLARVADAQRLGGRDNSGGALVEALWRAGFLEASDGDEPADRAMWEFHDRLFHETTRWNQEALTIGGTYRFEDKLPSPPAIKPAMAGERIDLTAPDLQRIAADSDPLEAIMARRKSVRDYGAQPISLAAVEEFLYRVARIKEVISAPKQDVLARPYPAGGAINELEFYLAVERCDGLTPGFYHYDGLNHALVRLPDTEDQAGQIVASSGMSMALEDGKPDLVIVLSSRLPRMAWKYERMAYRASLLHAGVVLQTMYLVATDMGLAPCANGTGSSRVFAEATGLDPWTETAIAEFALGSQPD